MMKALKFFLVPLMLLPLSLSAKDDIPLGQDPVPPPGEPTNPRSIEGEVTASIDDQVVTVSFCELTASQIVVTDSSDLTVFNQTYSAAYSVQANLTTLPSGSYTLHVYALGSWWYGIFIIE